MSCCLFCVCVCSTLVYHNPAPYLPIWHEWNVIQRTSTNLTALHVKFVHSMSNLSMLPKQHGLVAAVPSQRYHVSVGNLNTVLPSFCFILVIKYINLVYICYNCKFGFLHSNASSCLWTLQRHTDLWKELNTVDYSARHADVPLETVTLFFLIIQKMKKRDWKSLFRCFSEKEKISMIRFY